MKRNTFSNFIVLISVLLLVNIVLAISLPSENQSIDISTPNLASLIQPLQVSTQPVSTLPLVPPSSASLPSLLENIDTIDELDIPSNIPLITTLASTKQLSSTTPLTATVSSMNPTATAGAANFSMNVDWPYSPQDKYVKVWWHDIPREIGQTQIFSLTLTGPYIARIVHLTLRMECSNSTQDSSYTSYWSTNETLHRSHWITRFDWGSAPWLQTVESYHIGALFEVEDWSVVSSSLSTTTQQQQRQESLETQLLNSLLQKNDLNNDDIALVSFLAEQEDLQYGQEQEEEKEEVVLQPGQLHFKTIITSTNTTAIPINVTDTRIISPSIPIADKFETTLKSVKGTYLTRNITFSFSSINNDLTNATGLYFGLPITTKDVSFGLLEPKNALGFCYINKQQVIPVIGHILHIPILTTISKGSKVIVTCENVGLTTIYSSHNYEDEIVYTVALTPNLYDQAEHITYANNYYHKDAEIPSTFSFLEFFVVLGGVVIIIAGIIISVHIWQSRKERLEYEALLRDNLKAMENDPNYLRMKQEHAAFADDSDDDDDNDTTTSNTNSSTTYSPAVITKPAEDEQLLFTTAGSDSATLSPTNPLPSTSHQNDTFIIGDDDETIG